MKNDIINMTVKCKIWRIAEDAFNCVIPLFKKEGIKFIISESDFDKAIAEGNFILEEECR